MICKLCELWGHPTEKCARKCANCLDMPVVHQWKEDCPIITFLCENPTQPLPEVLQKKMIPPGRRTPKVEEKQLKELLN